MQAMAECSGPPQSTRKDVLGTFYPSPEPVDSSTPSSAPLSRRTLLRHSSFVRAVCVDAPVRICAGGDQRWSSLPRHLPPERFVISGLTTIRPESRLLLLSTPMPAKITELTLSFPMRRGGRRRYALVLEGASPRCRQILAFSPYAR